MASHPISVFGSSSTSPTSADQNYDGGEDDSEYYGTEQYTSDDDDYTVLVADHRRIDFFELDDLGLERLFQN